MDSNEFGYSPYLAQSAKVSQGLVVGMSNMLPINGSGLGPGGRGAGRRLEITRLVSQRMAPARNSKAADENILSEYKESRGIWIRMLNGKCKYARESRGRGEVQASKLKLCK